MPLYIPVIISFFALLVSILSFTRAWKIARNAQTMPVFIELMRQYRESIQPSYYYISNVELNISNDEPGLPISRMPDEYKKHALKVCHYFDNLGILLSSKIIHEKYLLNFIGSPAYNSWKILGSYIKKEREFRSEPPHTSYYQVYFEYFVQRYLEYNFQEKNKQFYKTMLDRRKNTARFPQFTENPM